MTNKKPLILENDASLTGIGSNLSVFAQQGSSGNVGGNIIISSGQGGTGAKGGDIINSLGQVITNVSGNFQIIDDAKTLLNFRQSAVSSCQLDIGTPGGALNNLAFNATSFGLTAGAGQLGLSTTTFSVNAATYSFVGTTAATFYIEDQDATVFTGIFDSQSATTLTFGEAVTSVSFSQAQNATSLPGAPWSIRAQQGDTGQIGGDLTIGGGNGGTPGTNTPGNTRVKVGTAVSNVSGKFIIEDEAGNSILDIYQSSASLSRITAGARSLRIGNLSESEIYIGGSGVTTVTSNANIVQIGGTGISLASASMAWASAITTATLTQSQSAGAGSPLIIEAQRGASANIGGDLTLKSGKGGTPGSNSAGKIILDVGATTFGASTKLQVKADTTTLLETYQSAASLTEITTANALRLSTTSSGNIFIEPAGFFAANSAGNIYLSSGTGITYYSLSGTTYKTVILATTSETTATTKSVYDFTATAGKIYYVHCTWVWSNDTSNHGATFVREMAAEFIGGTLSQIGTTDNAGTTDKIATGFYGAGTPDVVLDVNTDKIRARIITTGTDTINVNIELVIIERVQA